MKVFILVVICLMVAAPVFAVQKYNAFTNRWETCRDGDSLKYNGFSNKWSYQDDDSEIEYNGFENKWQWN